MYLHIFFQSSICKLQVNSSEVEVDIVQISELSVRVASERILPQGSDVKVQSCHLGPRAGNSYFDIIITKDIIILIADIIAIVKLIFVSKSTSLVGGAYCKHLDIAPRVLLKVRLIVIGGVGHNRYFNHHHHGHYPSSKSSSCAGYYQPAMRQAGLTEYCRHKARSPTKVLILEFCILL